MVDFQDMTPSETQIIGDLLDFRVLWGEDINTSAKKRALNKLIKRGILSFDKDDDNGGEVYWSREMRALLDANDPLVPEWIWEEYHN